MPYDAPMPDTDIALLKAWIRAGARGAQCIANAQGLGCQVETIAGLPGSEVVFDYAEPLENYSEERRATVIAVAESAAARGEPWLSLFDPAELAGMLHDKGFGTVEDLGMAEIADRFYGDLKQGVAIGPGAHLVRAKQAREDASGSAGSRSGAARSESWPKPASRICA